MNMFTMSSILVVVFVLLMPVQGFNLMNLFGLGKHVNKKDAIVKTIPDRPEDYFARFISLGKYSGKEKYVVDKVYSIKTPDEGTWSMDVLLKKQANNQKSQSYPLKYLKCTNITVVRQYKKGPYQVKNYICPGIIDDKHISKQLNKEIVAQASNQYAERLNNLTPKSGYFVWRILRASSMGRTSQKGDKVHVNVSLKLQLIKEEDIVKENPDILECTGIVVAYRGKPDKIKHKYFIMKNMGKCNK
ncbi:uncharacterized protein LOC103513879 isoform X1 [Diaphorina citri]|uniref:Uncharacterized protein LOC103513879 isoform X1 n=1 Tax=Diaphorina citri TaxID=121845 RepID=A0A1S3D911_DIACI|nr:uncharacterized protein LOC103513879 isoform X2 [Diaphorina citri]XP_008476951.1 uncharacterized protein LOC103513879 isoform X1 [Diaphorina citri]